MEEVKKEMVAETSPTAPPGEEKVKKRTKQKAVIDKSVPTRNAFNREAESTNRILSKSKMQLFEKMTEAKMPELTLKLNVRYKQRVWFI